MVVMLFSGHECKQTILSFKYLDAMGDKSKMHKQHETINLKLSFNWVTTITNFAKHICRWWHWSCTFSKRHLTHEMRQSFTQPLHRVLYLYTSNNCSYFDCVCTPQECIMRCVWVCTGMCLLLFSPENQMVTDQHINL